MKYLLLILIPLCVSCAYDETDDWRTAQYTYSCTDEQFQKVEKETTFCVDKVSIDKPYCFRTSIIRNCTKIQKK